MTWVYTNEGSVDWRERVVELPRHARGFGCAGLLEKFGWKLPFNKALDHHSTNHWSECWIIMEMEVMLYLQPISFG